MIQPKLKALWSSDLPDGTDPENPEHCAVPIQADIGPEGNGADTFSFVVVTRSYLASESGTTWGRGLLVIDCFSWDEVRLTVEKLLAHASRETWQEVATELSKEMHWEFENYRQSP